LFDGYAPQVLAVHFEQVEGAEHGGGIVPVFAEEIEHCEAVRIAHDRLTVDQAGLHRQQGHRRDDLRKAACEVVALAREQPHAAINPLGHDAEAVVLDLVNPPPARWRLLGRTGQAWLDEGGRLGQRTLAEPGPFNSRYRAGVESGPPQQLRQLGDVGRNPPRLVAGQ
jgi:hypothetical protein